MIKEEYLKDDSRMIGICEKLREPGDFLNAKNPLQNEQQGRAVTFPIQSCKNGMKLMISTEEDELSFIRAIDGDKIEDWHHFEYLLSFILENRLLRIYQAYINTVKGQKSKAIL